jgi:hypothetical protein
MNDVLHRAVAHPPCLPARHLPARPNVTAMAARRQIALDEEVKRTQDAGSTSLYFFSKASASAAFRAASAM